MVDGDDHAAGENIYPPPRLSSSASCPHLVTSPTWLSHKRRSPRMCRLDERSNSGIGPWGRTRLNRVGENAPQCCLQRRRH